MARLEFTIDSREVAHERLDGEVIAVHLPSGRYFSMCATSADLWFLVSSGVVRGSWREILEKEYLSAVPQEDLDLFATMCFEFGLVKEATDDAVLVPSATLPDDMARTGWTSPTIEAFDDLQDLILVDPVHETSDFGWPYAYGGDDQH